MRDISASRSVGSDVDAATNIDQSKMQMNDRNSLMQHISPDLEVCRSLLSTGMPNGNEAYIDCETDFVNANES